MDTTRASNAYGNVRRSVAVALIAATAFSAYVLVLSLLRGSLYWPKYEMTSAQIVWWSDAHPDAVRKDRTRPIALLLGVGIVLIGAALYYASRP